MEFAYFVSIMIKEANNLTTENGALRDENTGTLNAPFL
jgi:hypothetical protein